MALHCIACRREIDENNFYFKCIHCNGCLDLRCMQQLLSYLPASCPNLACSDNESLFIYLSQDPRSEQAYTTQLIPIARHAHFNSFKLTACILFLLIILLGIYSYFMTSTPSYKKKTTDKIINKSRFKKNNYSIHKKKLKKNTKRRFSKSKHKKNFQHKIYLNKKFKRRLIKFQNQVFSGDSKIDQALEKIYKEKK